MKRREKREARKARKRRQRLTFFLVTLTAFSAVLGVILFLASTPKEILVASRVVVIPLNQNATETFSHTGASVSQEMSTGCYVPATMKLTATKMTKAGRLLIYINDFYVGYADITSTGQVAISSGCGCSTTCICEILIGDNVIRFVSQGFSGEVKYEVYVKK